MGDRLGIPGAVSIPFLFSSISSRFSRGFRDVCAKFGHWPSFDGSWIDFNPMLTILEPLKDFNDISYIQLAEVNQSTRPL